MSTDWHVHCLDCKDTHHFDDANHQSSLMLLLCKHSDTIAALDLVMADKWPPNLWRESLRLTTPYGDVDTAWFRKHLGHNLIPIDENGHVLGQCAEWITCECGAVSQCGLEKGHEPPCKSERQVRG